MSSPSNERRSVGDTGHLPGVPPLDVLAVAPHPDDAELGMAGTILKMRAEGRRVGVLDLTDGEPTPHGTPEIRAQETARATEILGLDWRGNLALPNRSLEPTLDARAALAGVFRQCQARWIFAPYWADAHPDHLAATELVEAARFWAKLTKTDLPGEPYYPAQVFYYFAFHLRHLPEPSFVVDISEHWEAKERAIRAFHSQFIAGREGWEPSIPDRLREVASMWGFLISARYGEGFATREPLGLTSFGGVK